MPSFNWSCAHAESCMTRGCKLNAHAQNIAISIRRYRYHHVIAMIDILLYRPSSSTCTLSNINSSQFHTTVTLQIGNVNF